MASSHDDAVIVGNDSLRETIRRHRREQLAFLLGARRVANESPLHTRSEYGVVHSRSSLGVAPDADTTIGRLLAAFERCLEDYAFFGFELWFGSEAPTPRHNDAFFYLTTGQTVALQFWILLEACTLPADGTDAPVDATRGKNALECLVPAPDGVMFPGMGGVLTRDGMVDYRPDRVVGGDDMSIGDFLLFKNGVIHRATGSRDTFRAALAFRAHLATEDYADDIDTLLWFRDELRRNDAFAQRLIDSTNPYYPRVTRKLDSLPARAPDLSRVRKLDRNDHPSLRRRLAEFDFTAATAPSSQRS